MYPGRSLLETVDGPFIDTGVEMAVGGRVYIDPVSAAEIARLMPPAEVESLRKKLRVQGELLEAANAELARLRPIAAAVHEVSLAHAPLDADASGADRLARSL